jgi:hypothetical protein
MPYRRLPNTDAARIRAIKRALEKGKEVPPSHLAYPARIIVVLQKFITLFENHIQIYRLATASQNARSKEFQEAFRKAKIYLTHFVRVMNMAIYRGDIPASIRSFYGLSPNELTIPSVRTEKELITWGNKIIEGEEMRLRKGGSPVTNPTIAVVKVRFKNFIDLYNSRQILIKKTSDLGERTNSMRKEADDIILETWNEIEQSFGSLPDDLKKIRCEDYGVVYFYRKNEKKASADVAHSDVR